MLLSDRDIRHAMERGDIVIDPLDEQQLGSNSYDLRLDDTLKTYVDEVLDPRDQPEVETLKIPEEGRVLQPNNVYLGSTVEWTETRHFVPVLEGKSSMARLGLSVVSDGGFGDIGFRGCWTLELSVKKPVRVYPGMDICQISYLTSGPCDLPYIDKPSARYANRREALEYLPSSDGENRGEGAPETTPRGMRIPVVRTDGTDDIPLPERATDGSSAVDLHAAVEEPLHVESGEVAVVPSGLKIAVPRGWEAQIRARSGLAKEGLIIPNGPGTIDADYRGEIKVMLLNLRSEPFRIERGDRIAQMTIQRIERFEWDPRPDLDETLRGEGGFGSTGVRENTPPPDGP